MKNLKAAMMTSISNVLETMFFMSLDFDTHATLENSDIILNDITMACHLDFSGPFAGSFLLFVPEKLLVDMTGSFMGIEPDQIATPHLEGTIKELTNMIAGNTFSTMNNQLAFKLAIPELINIRTMPRRYLTTRQHDLEIITETTGGFLAVKIILNDETAYKG